MKDMFRAGMAMAVIIAVQMMLSYAFAYRVGEIFSRVSFVALFYYYVFKENNERLKTKQKK